MDKVNIYQVLNRFNHLFGEQPVKIEIAYVENEHIFVRMIYDEDVDLPPSEDHNEWNSVCNSGMNYGMVKIWVRRNENTGKPEFIIWNDNIYINSYIMPDEEKSNRFWLARKQFSECTSNLMFGSEYVELSERMLTKAIEAVNKTIKKYKEDLYASKNIDEIQTRAKGIDSSVETLRILREAREDVREKRKRSD